MKLKTLGLLSFLFTSMIAHAQKRFDYKIVKDTCALVIYRMMYDTLQNGAFLAASNIYFNGRYFPLADNGRSISALSDIGLTYEPLLEDKCKAIITILNKADTNVFLSLKFFSDSVILGNTNRNAHIIGGEQFIKKEKPEYSSMHVMYFYVSFRIKADFLFIWEGKEPPFYMRKWAPQLSYNYANNSSNPTVLLLKIKSEKPLTKKEQLELGLYKMNRIEYDYFHW